MIKRQVIELIGGLDEGYLMGNFEDDDYCLKTRLLGYKLAIAQNAFVFHHGSKTFQTNKLKHNEWMDHNRLRFFERLTEISTSLQPTITRAKQMTQKHDTPRVSVIVRTQNRPEILRLALTSLANQTIDDFEVVLVNDGGSDLAEIINEFSPYLNIRYIHHETAKGRTPALNAGLKNSQGEFLSYLDDDDVVYPFHLEVLLNEIQNPARNSDFAYSDYNRVLLTSRDPHSPVTGRTPMPSWHYDSEELLIRNNIPIHCWIHTKDIIEKTGYFDEQLDSLEDWDFLIRASKHTEFSHIARVTCEYRFFEDGSNSIVGQRSTALASMKTIYERYHVDENSEIYRQRVDEMRRAEEQVQLISVMQEQIEANPAEQQKLLRKILEVAVNFDQTRYQ